MSSFTIRESAGSSMMALVKFQMPFTPARTAASAAIWAYWEGTHSTAMSTSFSAQNSLTMAESYTGMPRFV